MVPRGMPERAPGRAGTRRSRAAPRGGSPSSAGRSTARCPRSSSSFALWKKKRPKSKSARRHALRRRRATCFSGRCQPRGRTISVGRLVAERVGLARLGLRRSGSCAAPRRAGSSDPRPRSSRSATFASSKSAMKTFAPELSALMIILRSTGPVISTRRSCRSSGQRAPPSSRPRARRRLRRGSPERSPASNRAWRSRRRASSSSTRGRRSARHELGDERERVRGRGRRSGPARAARCRSRPGPAARVVIAGAP